MSVQDILVYPVPNTLTFYELQCICANLRTAGYDGATLDAVILDAVIRVLAPDLRGRSEERDNYRQTVVERARPKRIAPSDVVRRRLPLGYRREGLRGERIGIDERGAMTVRLIFALRDAGISLSGIAEELNLQGIPTAHGGKCWYAATVRNILHNEPIYSSGSGPDSAVRLPAILTPRTPSQKSLLARL